MVQTTQKFEDDLRAKLSKTLKDPFQIELIISLERIHMDLDYAERDRSKQTQDIANELYKIREALESR